MLQEVENRDSNNADLVGSFATIRRQYDILDNLVELAREVSESPWPLQGLARARPTTRFASPPPARYARKQEGGAKLSEHTARRPASATRVKVSHLNGIDVRHSRDWVATEEPLELRLLYERGGKLETQSVSVTMRTPGADFELAAGFLFAEGVLRAQRDLDSLAYCTEEGQEQLYNIVNVRLAPDVTFDPARLQRNFYATSSCGVCGKASLEALEIQGCPVLGPGPVVSESLIKRLPDRLRAGQALFERTGGLHGAGLFAPDGELLCLREDVGRHNAVDKAVGWGFLQDKLPLSGSILFLSGRAGFELVQKALMAGIPTVAAVGAPSSLAVQTARAFNLTLLGFVGPTRFNVYSGAERVRFPNGAR